MELYDFHLSVSSYRVRIGLALKGLPYTRHALSLSRDGGEQHSAEFRALNPQGMVPTLLDDDFVLTESLAILEYLDEIHPEPPLLPRDARTRARVRQLAQIMVSDIAPLTNLRVITYLRTSLKTNEIDRSKWFRHWLLEGLDALELWLMADGPSDGYCLGGQPTLADVCLVPLLYGARRFGLPLDDFPQLCRIEEHCIAHPAFQKAAPRA
jgi:maleylacetoacetate isomerase